MKNLKSILMAVGLGTMAASAFAQGTAFTYQGRLNSGANPANGSYDMAFSLFATNVAGTPIAGPVTNTAVPVTNGLFTTLVNFTNGFSGGSNWLQVAVSSNGLNAFNALLPRQQLTPVPYAVLAGGVPGLVIQPNADSPNVILGYAGNSVTGGAEGSFIGGGGGNNVGLGLTPNTANGSFDVIDGGFGNNVLGFAGTIGGGYNNSAGPGNVTGAEVVGGGYQNNASGDASVIAGGEQNTASGDVSAIGGGIDNLASGKGAVIAGGGYDGSAAYGNTASGNASVVGGGMNNNASGAYATVPGGTNNSAAGNFSFAAGQRAQALNQGAFVWADSQNSTFASTASDQFLIRAQGGVGIGTTTPITSIGYPAGWTGLHTLAPNAGVNIIEGGTQARLHLRNDGNAANVSQDFVIDNFANQIDFRWLGAGLANTYPPALTISTNLNNSTAANVGIGTTTPNSTLAVVGNIYFGKQRPNTTFNQIGDTIYLGAEQKYLGNTLQTPVDGSTDWINLMANPLSAGIILGVSSSSTVNPHSNAVPLMVIKSNGNVGIGGGSATNPATALQVNGTVTATSFSGSFSGSGTSLTGVALLSGGNALTGQQTVMSGNVGIGTTSPTTEKLVVAGGADFTTAAANPTTDSGLGLSFESYGGRIQFFQSKPLILNPSGNNVGIGTTTPTGPFAVATPSGTVTIATGQFTPELIMSGGIADGALRLRNRLEVWPKTNLTAAGYLDIRATNGTPTIILDGTNGAVAATYLRSPGQGINTGTYAFIQRAVGTNTLGNITTIYNPICNGDPNAILIVTHNWSYDTNSTSPYNTTPVGVYYAAPNWTIFNEDASAMALGRAFNVMVIKP